MARDEGIRAVSSAWVIVRAFFIIGVVSCQADPGRSQTPTEPAEASPEAALICEGTWSRQWPNLCHDGKPVHGERVLVFSDGSSAETRAEVAGMADVAISRVMERTATSWADFTFMPYYEEPLIHVFSDYDQQAVSGLAYAHGIVVRAPDSPRYGSAGWPRERWNNVLRHELAHVVEFLLIGTRHAGANSVWFREGFASWAAGISSILSAEQVRDWQTSMESVPGGGNPIGIYRWRDFPEGIREDPSQNIRYYPFFELAARYLLDPEGNGTSVEDLKAMFDSVGAGVPLQTAFRDSFGLAIEEYEATFWERMEAYLGE
ncbi:MAG: hypothetical protein ABFS34_00870 [Gemmatimonadota bacterium]